MSRQELFVWTALWGFVAHVLCGGALQAQNRIDGDGFAQREQLAQHPSPLAEGMIAAARQEI